MRAVVMGSLAASSIIGLALIAAGVVSWGVRAVALLTLLGFFVRTHTDRVSVLRARLRRCLTISCFWNSSRDQGEGRLTGTTRRCWRGVRRSTRRSLGQGLVI